MSPSDYLFSKKPSSKNPVISTGRKLTKQTPRVSNKHNHNNNRAEPSNTPLQIHPHQFHSPPRIPARSSSLRSPTQAPASAIKRASAIDKSTISAPIPIPPRFEITSLTVERGRDRNPRPVPAPAPDRDPIEDDIFWTQIQTRTRTQIPKPATATATIKCTCEDAEEINAREERLRGLNAQEREVLESWRGERTCWCGRGGLEELEDREWDIREISRREKIEDTGREKMDVVEWLEAMKREVGYDDEEGLEYGLEEDLEELKWRGKRVQWDRRERRRNFLGHAERVIERPLEMRDADARAWWERERKYENGKLRRSSLRRDLRREVRAKEKRNEDEVKQEEDKEQEGRQEDNIHLELGELRERKRQLMSSFYRSHLPIPTRNSTGQSLATDQGQEQEEALAYEPSTEPEGDSKQGIAQQNYQEADLERRQRPEQETLMQRPSSPAGSESSDDTFWTADEQLEEPAKQFTDAGSSYHSRTDSNAHHSFTQSVFENSSEEEESSLACEESTEPFDRDVYDEAGFLRDLREKLGRGQVESREETLDSRVGNLQNKHASATKPGESSARGRAEPFGERILSYKEETNEEYNAGKGNIDNDEDNDADDDEDDDEDNSTEKVTINNTTNTTATNNTPTVPKTPRHVSFAEGTTSPSLSRSRSTTGHGALRARLPLRSKSLSSLLIPPLTPSAPHNHNYVYIPPPDIHLRSEKYILGDTGTGSRKTSMYTPRRRERELWSHHSVGVFGGRYSRVGERVGRGVRGRGSQEEEEEEDGEPDEPEIGIAI